MEMTLKHFVYSWDGRTEFWKIVSPSNKIKMLIIVNCLPVISIIYILWPFKVSKGELLKLIINTCVGRVRQPFLLSMVCQTLTFRNYKILLFKKESIIKKWPNKAPLFQIKCQKVESLLFKGAVEHVFYQTLSFNLAIFLQFS